MRAILNVRSRVNLTLVSTGGLGCVIHSQIIMQSPSGKPVVRQNAEIPNDQVIMICVSMGYPDDRLPAKAVVSRPKSIDEAGVFVGFDDWSVSTDG